MKATYSWMLSTSQLSPSGAPSARYSTTGTLRIAATISLLRFLPQKVPAMSGTIAISSR